MKSNQTSLLPDWPARRVFEATLVIIGVFLGFWLIYFGRIALFSLFTAIVLSTAIAPAVDWLRRRGLPAGAGVVLIYLALLAGVIGLGLLMVPLLTVQGAHIVASFGDLYARLIAFLGQSPSYLLHRLLSELPPTLALAAPPTASQPATLAALLGALAYAGLLGDGLFALVSVMLLAFYWTLERDRVLRWLMLLLPAGTRDQARDLITASENKVGGYIRGVAVLSLMVGALAFGAYLVMGLPFALLLAILAGLIEAVPVIGPALGTIPALIVALAVAPDKIVWVVLAHSVIQVLENYVLAPRVMRHTVGVNPVVTLLSLLAFGSLLGLPGALMAIPIAAVVQLLLDHFVLRPEAALTHVPAGRDSLSVVRYDARELVRDVRNQWRDQAAGLPSDGINAVEETVEALAADLDDLLAHASEAQARSGATMKRLALLTATAIATLAGAWLLWQFRSVLLLFLLSLGLAAALRPLVDGQEHAWHWPRPAALLTVYGLTLATLIIVVVAVSGPVLDDLRRSADQFVLTYDSIWATWPLGSPFQQSIAAWLPPPHELYASVTGAQGAAIAQSLLGVTLSLVDLVSRVSIVVVMSIYWGMDQARFERLWLSLLPAGQRTRALEIWRAMETGLGAYLRSELIQSLLAGLLLGVGYRLLQMPYPALLATISALVWLVPWLGAVLGLGLVLLAGLAVGPWITLAACVYSVLVFALLEFAVEPRLYNRRQFSSLLVVLLVIALWNAAGLLGLLAAPPLAAALQILVTNLLAPGTEAVSQPIEQRFAALEDRLATLDASLGTAAEAPSPQVASLVSRLGALLTKARQALSNQGALPAEGAAPAAPSTSGGATPGRAAR